MKHFITTASSFVIIGICVAIICAYYHKKDRKSGEDTENYMIVGMGVGVCLGAVFSAMLKINVGLGVSLGMLVGETIGILVKRK